MQIFDKSALAKYYGTHFAAEIVTEACSLIKAANLKNPLIKRVAREIVFGPKHQMADKDMACHFSELLNHSITNK